MERRGRGAPKEWVIANRLETLECCVDLPVHGVHAEVEILCAAGLHETGKPIDGGRGDVIVDAGCHDARTLARRARAQLEMRCIKRQGRLRREDSRKCAAQTPNHRAGTGATGTSAIESGRRDDGS